MDQADIIQRTADHIEQEFQDDSSGHDWWHVHRVWRTALFLCEREKADAFVVQLAALLHDLDDWKLNQDGDKTPRRARKWMESCGVDPKIIEQVCEIIEHISFKGAAVEETMPSLEGRIVQDADRLDAIGAIGIGRAFAFGGTKNRMIFDPASPPRQHASFEEYRSSTSATINHFYEKLLLLKDRMNTPTAKSIAEARHAIMLRYLEQFMGEWEGRDIK
ncbi:MAG: HD domain-containing protein [Chloroflexi bacterium]|nr:HD domain-containing protein [Chloroflexota bacterium]